MTVITERLIIRPFIESDLDTFIEYRNDEAWMIYQDFKGYTKEEYKKMIIDDVIDIHRGVQLAITDKVTGHLFGDLYVILTNGELWIGYTIHPKHARKGYTFEAVESLYPWLKAQGVDTIHLSAHANNHASLNLIKKLGFKENGIEEEHGDLAFIKHI